MSGHASERVIRAVLVTTLVVIAGCAAWDAESRARDRAREWLDCEQVELTRHSEHAWRAEGCGRHADVACTTSDNEPECIRVRFPTTVAIAAPPPEPEPDAPSAADLPVSSPAPETQGAEVTAAEAAVRAALDAAHADVLACVARDRVVVRATWDAAGVVSLALQGDLAGSPEEGCVRAALSALSAPAGAAGTVLHLVRDPG